jgi:hypothetical protein
MYKEIVLELDLICLFSLDHMKAFLLAAYFAHRVGLIPRDLEGMSRVLLVHTSVANCFRT